ncbi:class F sortase [Streptomyces sp. TRM43335]|uniref:Class F sortase n=1 Tax=Streptomyces taklimakanensis TaxID=2569853 RepID=A0A6G2BAB6_9ACTN|nr:class F sortase [Streptomyces taklimakanensis]MTE19200.1 class F sortase [Streptomyces taklimakanensis]
MAREPRTSAGGRLVALVVWTVLLLGVWWWGRELTDPTPAPSPAPPAVSAVPPDGSARGGAGMGRALPPAREPLPGSEPRRVEVEAAGVDARVVARGLDGHGAVEPPPMTEPDLVGWYEDGAAPGAEGVAVLVGHLDTDTGTAVFHRLPSVRPDDRVRVARADGTVAEFTVEEVATAEREGFDPDEVYGPRRPGRAELRLITCTGEFDREDGSYTANLVVSAYLTGVRPA